VNKGKYEQYSTAIKKGNEKCKHMMALRCQLQAAFNAPGIPESNMLHQKQPGILLPSLCKNIGSIVSI
jgi:hypothetical protein